MKNKNLEMSKILCILLVLGGICAGLANGFSRATLTSANCFPVREDSKALVCRVIPDCSASDTLKTFAKYKRLIFDLENKYHLSSRQFYNCSFSWSSQIEITFKNIRKLSSFSFDSIRLDENVQLLIRFDGSGLNLDKHKSNSKFLVNENSFNNIVLAKRAQLTVEIRNYQNLLIKDNLVQNIAWQSEVSGLSLSLLNIEQIMFKNRNGKNLDDDLSDYDTDELDESNPSPLKYTQMNSLKNNLTYTLEVSNSNSLVFDPQVFSNIQVNSYSDFNILIKNVNNLYLGNGLFDSLMLGYYSKCNIILENLNTISLGKSLFSGLQTDQYSVFYFHLEKVGSKINISKREAAGDYEEELNYEDNYPDYEDQLEVSSFSSWLCVPEAFFKNIRMSSSSLIQIHFTQIEMSMSISPDAFKEIELAENSKFQLMFQDIKGNVLFSENSLSLLKLSDGLFELWLDTQKNVNKNKNQTAEFVSKSTISSYSKSPVRFLNNLKTNYFRFMDSSINKVFLTSRSNFRLGFLNSDSVILLNSKSLSDFHLDRLDKSKRVY